MSEKSLASGSRWAVRGGGEPRGAPLRVFLGSLGLANLCALNLWHDIQRLQARFVDYYRAAPAGHALFAGTILVVLASTLVFFAAGLLARRARRPRLRRALGALFMLAFVIPAFHLHYVCEGADLSPGLLGLAKVLVFLLYIGVLGSVVFYLASGSERLARAIAALNLVLSPLFFVSVASYAHWAVRDSPLKENIPGSPPAPARHAPSEPPARILWLIFDEFDYDFSFAHRPKDLVLPELDRLRSESLFAQSAYPPAGETLRSMPSLISGTVCDGAEIGGPSLLRLRCGDSGFSAWASPQTVFATMSRRSVQVGVVGWFHPYCRMFADVLSCCAFVPSTNTVLLVREAHARDLGPLRSAWYLLRSQVALLPLAPRTLAPDIVTLGRVQQLREFREVHRHALEQALEPGLGLVLVHYPIPHPYGIYDRRAGTFSLAAGSTYIDNLALVDRVIGELRRELERAGLRDRTAWIVSSDHALRDFWGRLILGREPVPPGKHREGEGKVPFIIRLPGETQGREYVHRVNTVVTAGLITVMAEGKIRSLDELENWLRSAGGERAAR